MQVLTQMLLTSHQDISQIFATYINPLPKWEELQLPVKGLDQHFVKRETNSEHKSEIN